MKKFQECDKDLYPAINGLIRVLATFPVSVATGERSFSGSEHPWQKKG